jgi:hypothetical protein
MVSIEEDLDASFEVRFVMVGLALKINVIFK